jgi:hypothetical protein
MTRFLGVMKKNKQPQRQKQIPFGDDKQKATANAKATAKAKCGVLRSTHPMVLGGSLSE